MISKQANSKNCQNKEKIHQEEYTDDEADEKKYNRHTE